MKDIIVLFFLVVIFYYLLNFVINCLIKELRNKEKLLIEGMDSETQARNYQNLAAYKAQKTQSEVGDAGATFMIVVLVTIILLVALGIGGWYLYQENINKQTQMSIDLMKKPEVSVEPNKSIIPKNKSIIKSKPEPILSDEEKLVNKVAENLKNNLKG